MWRQSLRLNRCITSAWAAIIQRGVKKRHTTCAREVQAICCCSNGEQLDEEALTQVLQLLVLYLQWNFVEFLPFL